MYQPNTLTDNPTGDSHAYDTCNSNAWNNIFSTCEEISHYVDEILSREGNVVNEQSGITWYLKQLYAATKCLKQLQENI